jgi:hypothetical protein
VDEDHLSAYETLTRSLLRDEHRDVDLTPDGLRVRGRLFAFLDGADLVVHLPEDRIAELQGREVAESFEVVAHENRTWARVSDWHLWPEMAREAHQYVGHGQLGGQS